MLTPFVKKTKITYNNSRHLRNNIHTKYMPGQKELLEAIGSEILAEKSIMGDLEG